MNATQALPRIEQGAATIRGRLCPNCYVCSGHGKLLYQNLTDRLFGAPGTWNLRKCPNQKCGTVWLDPMPLEEDLYKAYATYYTHAPIPDSLVYRFRQRVKRGYAGLAYGYRQRVSLVDRILALPQYCCHRCVSKLWLLG